MSDGRIPILYMAPWIDLGGSDRATIDWFKSIDRERWAPSLITTAPSPNRWLAQVEPYAEEIWPLPDLMPGAAFPEFVLGFVESRGVGLVHLMNSRLGFDLLPDMIRLPNPPAIVVQLHAEEPDRAGYVRYVTRRYGNLIDAFSVVSEDLKRTIVGYEVPPSRVEAIYLGVDGEGEFDPSRVDPPAAPGGPRRILWPGRLVEQKDPLLTMEVVARARRLGADGFVLDVVGDGHLEEAARARADQLGIAELVGWHPPARRMAGWYRGSDLLLMTSVYEGIPLVIYEALAMGLPVVAPALPGNVELMDADSGVLVDPRDDVDAYAAAIVALLGDDRRREEMGARSRRRMLERFSLAEMGRRHDELYGRLLAERAGAGRAADRTPAAPAPVPAPPPVRLPRDPPPERTVGVIVPCYRHGIFLGCCIASIRAQSLPPARIVVVDDGSDDEETIAALARLDGDPDVTVLRQDENLGPSAARNRALAELETSYFLPIDADDELLPDALERMLGQLERAPGDIGFVYPNAQHFGDRHDYAPSPAYNQWLLMVQNFCPAPALFDRRAFAATGVAYPEGIVVGHEDWDLVLQLAEREVRGIPAEGPTFRYRKQGFSRADAVDHGVEAFRRLIERRHPHLYERRAEIKARWAPALSVVLLDEEGGRWRDADLAGLRDQTCVDFEVLAADEIGDGVRQVGRAGDPLGAWLQAAIDAARGRWLLLLPRSVAGALASRTFVEQLIRSFSAEDYVAGVVLAGAAGPGRSAFTQLDDDERHSAEPAAVAFARPLWGRVAPLRLGGEGSPLGDFVVGLQGIGRVQWRIAPVAGDGVPRLRLRSPAEQAEALDPGLPRDLGEAEAAMRHGAAHQAPCLPGGPPGAVRRWRAPEHWTPPQTRLLCRHLDARSGLRTVTLGRKPPPGYEFERVLCLTHAWSAPGMTRLVNTERGFALSEEQGAVAGAQLDLGWVEARPLPLLEEVQLRRLRESGQETLAVGIDDPLFAESELVERLGWAEAYPILPRASETIFTGPWRVDSLRVYSDRGGRRHRYRTGPPGTATGGVEIGLLQRRPGPADVALRLRPDGRLASELCTPGRATRDPRKIGRWLAEPLAAAEGSPAAPDRARARLRHLATHFGDRRQAEEDGTVLGWLGRSVSAGRGPLYSTIHPVTGDQLVTRFPERASESGYALDGFLGSIFA